MEGATGVGTIAHRGRSRPTLRSESGAVATEYGLLLLFVALAIILAVTAVGLAVLRLFQAGADAFP